MRAFCSSEEEKEVAKKIVFASGKGGVGKTTMAVGIGKALSKAGKSVLIVDFDNLRGVDLLVGAAESVVYDWGDVLLDRCLPENAVYEADGLSIISCPRKYDSFTSKQVGAFIKSFDKKFDFILCDAPAGVGRGLHLAFAGADKGIIVATPDYVCVRGSFTAADEMIDGGITDVRLIINRAVKKDIKKKKMLNIDDVIDRAAVQLIGVVPEDPSLRFGAMGISIYKKKQVSYPALTNIAKRIEGESVPLAFG